MEKCIEAMKNADMVILVMGKRYGYIPTICEFPFDGNTSVTHAEYKIAVKYNKERGRNNFLNYASQLQAAFVRSQITNILK